MSKQSHTPGPTEFCPICQKQHEVPKTKFDRDGKGYKDLIDCSCGAKLKAVMPFFRMSQSGYLFQNVAIDRAIARARGES